MNGGSVGTIARSGTKAFMEALRPRKVAQAPHLIGQFGVGFYSAIYGRRSVEVCHVAPVRMKHGHGRRREGTFSIAPAALDVAARRGAPAVILHLMDDAR